jgi:hypothetical protein
MVNVIVTRPRQPKTVTVKSSSSFGGANRLDALIDVNASNETDNATLVYNANNDTYIVKQIDLDGGEF